MKLYSYILLFSFVFTSVLVGKNPQQKEKPKSKDKTSQTTLKDPKNKPNTAVALGKDAKEITELELKTDSVKVKEVVVPVDTLENYKFKFYKKNAHASYYHQRFHGRRTASGKKFDNNGYTAAHKKLPFGTKIKVTNEANGKSVIVEVTDRGPFSKVREIDLTKKAFMEITSNKNSGVAIVKLEVIEPKK